MDRANAAIVGAAYDAATKHKGQPTLILPKTVKGYGMGESGEGQMISHQAKKMTQDALKQFRDRFDIPMPDEKIDEMARGLDAGRWMMRFALYGDESIVDLGRAAADRLGLAFEHRHVGLGPFTTSIQHGVAVSLTRRVA